MGRGSRTERGGEGRGSGGEGWGGGKREESEGVEMGREGKKGRQYKLRREGSEGGAHPTNRAQAGGQMKAVVRSRQYSVGWACTAAQYVERGPKYKVVEDRQMDLAAARRVHSYIPLVLWP